MLNKEQILNELLETHGISPWKILIEEGKKEEVNSDDEPSAGDESLSDNDKNNIAQGLANGDITEEQFKKMVNNGDLDKDDANEITQMAQELAQNQEMTPEEEQMMQITQVQDMTVRFALYEKFTKLNEKIEYFLDFFQDVANPIYKEVEYIKEYLDVVSSLVFNLEINLLYQLYFQLESKLIELFQGYLQEDPQLQEI